MSDDNEVSAGMSSELVQVLWETLAELYGSASVYPSDDIRRMAHDITTIRAERDALRAQLDAERQSKGTHYLWERIRERNTARKSAQAERDAAVALAEANGRAAKVRQSHIDDLQKMLDAAEAERDALRDNAALMNDAASRYLRRAEQAERERGTLRAELAAKDRTLGENIRQTLLEQKRAEAAEAERDKLREVLRPFAKAADNFDSFPIKDAEGWFAYSGQSSFNKVTGAITVGDLRRARAALNKGGGDE